MQRPLRETLLGKKLEYIERVDFIRLDDEEETNKDKKYWPDSEFMTST
jgi:hypothetical protein